MTPGTITFAANQGDIGGGEVMLLHLAQAARELAVPVHVVAPGGSDVLATARDQGFEATGLGTSRRDYLLQLARWSRGRGLLWCNGLAPAFATSGRRDRVVHLHQVPRGKQVHLARAARVRALVTLVPSRSTASEVRGARVLENWTSDIAPRTERRGDWMTVGFLGRPSVEKGVVVLAEAMRVLGKRRDDPPRLLLAGEPRFVGETERRAVQEALRPIDALVDRPGWIDPHDFFSQVDVAVFPSVWQEPFGLVVAEAMSARVPFVVSDAGALPEVAGPDHPWVAPAGDAVRLADTIEAALGASPHVRDAAVAEARQRWEACFSPAAGRDRLTRLLRELHLF
jgi:phosphatidylinositol alpha-mannosyltransferase